jgi:hypothetical protein
MLKKFLILTGASFVGFFISVVLHNFLYAATEITKEIAVLPYIFEALHILFFFLAVLVCPAGFLVGAVGSIVLFVKGKIRKNN